MAERGFYVTGKTLSHAIQAVRSQKGWAQRPTRDLTEAMLDVIEADVLTPLSLQEAARLMAESGGHASDCSAVSEGWGQCDYCDGRSAYEALNPRWHPYPSGSMGPCIICGQPKSDSVHSAPDV